MVVGREQNEAAITYAASGAICIRCERTLRPICPRSLSLWLGHLLKMAGVCGPSRENANRHKSAIDTSAKDATLCLTPATACFLVVCLLILERGGRAHSLLLTTSYRRKSRARVSLCMWGCAPNQYLLAALSATDHISVK